MNSLLPLELSSVCFEYPLIISVNLTSVFCFSLLEVPLWMCKTSRKTNGRQRSESELFLLCAFDCLQIPLSNITILRRENLTQLCRHSSLELHLHLCVYTPSQFPPKLTSLFLQLFITFLHITSVT